MHVGISTLPTKGGHANRGVGGYTKHLIEALAAHYPDNTYTLFADLKELREPCDLIHYPFFDPFFLTLRIPDHIPTVVTVHDLIPIVFPQHFPKGLRGTLKWHIQKRALRRAARILTDSACSKKDIADLTGIDPKRIDVIPLASGINPETEPTEWNELKKRYDVGGEYCLYVGDVNWNKNIPGLLEGFAGFLNGQAGKALKPLLVLVGKAFLDLDLPETRDINRLIDQLHLGSSVRRTGFVPDEDLAGLYRYARVCIQPSWYEGFGFPVIESFTFGSPVIASTTSSLPEIAGPSYPMDPADPASLTASLTGIFSLSAQERQQLVQKGRSWIRRFSWKKVASDTMASYANVLEAK